MSEHLATQSRRYESRHQVRDSLELHSCMCSGLLSVHLCCRMGRGRTLWLLEVLRNEDGVWVTFFTGIYKVEQRGQRSPERDISDHSGMAAMQLAGLSNMST